jgi:iron-sulfur cluster repair protein YtfE (RIC family)
MTITDVLRTEHRLLRTMMQALGDELAEEAPAEALRQRGIMLGIALEAHAQREEQMLFAPLRSHSATIQHLITLMEVVHDEVRTLLEEIADPARSTRGRLWAILDLTEEHFVKEEDELFPLAELLLESETLAHLAQAGQLSA